MQLHLNKSKEAPDLPTNPLLCSHSHLDKSNPCITLLKPKILQYSCLFFLSHPMLKQSHDFTFKIFPESNHFSPTLSNIMSPSIIAGASDLVFLLPFLHYFGPFFIQQPEEPLKQVRPCHTSVDPPIVPHLTHSKT